eukprot:jgi/Bigna1/86306/estExt_fgenesh1_pg.C_90244
MGGKPSVKKMLQKIMKKNLKYVEEVLRNPGIMLEANIATIRETQGEEIAMQELKNRMVEDLTQRQTGNLTKLWVLIDKNKNGIIDSSEMKELLEAYTEVLVNVLTGSKQMGILMKKGFTKSFALTMQGAYLNFLIFPALKASNPEERFEDNDVFMNSIIREVPTILARVIREEFGTAEFRDSVKKKMDTNNDGEVDRQEFLSNFINAIAYLGNDPSIQSKVQTQVNAMAMRIIGSPNSVNAGRIEEIEAIEKKLEARVQKLMEDESGSESESDGSGEADSQHQSEQKVGIPGSPKFQPFTDCTKKLELKAPSAEKYARLQSNESNEPIEEIGGGDAVSKTSEGESENGDSILGAYEKMESLDVDS